MKHLLLPSLALSMVALTAPAQNAPIMGWSSWNTYHVNISDTLIMRQADALVGLGLKSMGYSYVNIDDGFFGHRAQDGTMVPHEGRFPRGVKPVADHIHSLGLKAGIYSDAGTNTCGSRFDNDANGFGSGLYGHEEQDARLYFKEWGFDFIKIDYCGGFYDLSLDEQTRYTAIRRAIDATGRKDISINICRWNFPGTWAAGLAASWRISPDIRPRWSSVKKIIGLNLPLSAYCRGGHYNDMDMLEVNRGLSDVEEQTHFAMWCIMSSPLLIGCDLTKLTPATLALISNPELIALNQDPLHLQAYPVWRKGEAWALVKDIEKAHGRTRAVALYNASDTTAHFSLPLSALQMEGKVKLRDLVRRKNLKAVKDSLVADVPAHGTLVLKAEAERRTEATVYEAEWAYMPLYNALGKDKRTIRYAEREGASLGMAAEYIGGQKENILRWDNVQSLQGGQYELTIYYAPAAHRGLEVTVNGQRVLTAKSEDLPTTASTPDAPWQQFSLPITLRPGQNTVELGSSYSWAVDIDKIELKNCR